MTTRHSFALASVLLALFWGCSSPVEMEDPEQVTIVQAFLVPGQDTAVKLRQTLPPERYYEGLADSLINARVEISTGTQTFVLSEDPGEKGTYRIPHDIMPVVSGNIYHLQVTHGDRQVRASTEVPFQAEITEFTADTVVYHQYYGNLFGDLMHPGEWRWTRSENAAGYVIIVEAVDVRCLGSWALPLTADLDTLIARRERLEGQVSQDSLESLDRQIANLQGFFRGNVSMVDDNGDTLRWLRDRDQDDWDEIDLKEKWTEGKKWRKRMDELYWSRQVDYWVPADTLRADYWWLGLRFEGDYQITVQAADRNYVDYFTTAGHGHSGADGDRGPLCHVDGGLGVFGSYAEDRFRIQTVRGAEGQGMKVTAQR